MRYLDIQTLLSEEPLLNEVTVKGWVRSFRSNRFVALNDLAKKALRNKAVQKPKFKVR